MVFLGSWGCGRSWGFGVLGWRVNCVSDVFCLANLSIVNYLSTESYHPSHEQVGDERKEEIDYSNQNLIIKSSSPPARNHYDVKCSYSPSRTLRSVIVKPSEFMSCRRRSFHPRKVCMVCVCSGLGWEVKGYATGQRREKKPAGCLTFTRLFGSMSIRNTQHHQVKPKLTPHPPYADPTPPHRTPPPAHPPHPQLPQPQTNTHPAYRTHPQISASRRRPPARADPPR